MNPVRRTVLLLSLLAVVAYGLYFAVTREHTLRHGALVLLELAPRDPRSLLQGDYMDLRYTITNDLPPTALPTTGYLFLVTNGRGEVTAVRPGVDLADLRADELPLTYRLRGSGWRGGERMLLGAESYFFEEGLADTFARARYGGLRLDGKGGSVLAGLYDADLQLIDPAR